MKPHSPALCLCSVPLTSCNHLHYSSSFITCYVVRFLSEYTNVRPSSPGLNSWSCSLLCHHAPWTGSYFHLNVSVLSSLKFSLENIKQFKLILLFLVFVFSFSFSCNEPLHLTLWSVNSLVSLQPQIFSLSHMSCVHLREFHLAYCSVTSEVLVLAKFNGPILAFPSLRFPETQIQLTTMHMLKLNPLVLNIPFPGPCLPLSLSV